MEKTDVVQNRVLIKLRQEIFVRWITRRGNFLSIYLCGIAQWEFPAQGRAEGDYQIFRNPTLSAAAAAALGKSEREMIFWRRRVRERESAEHFRSAFQERARLVVACIIFRRRVSGTHTWLGARGFCAPDARTKHADGSELWPKGLKCGGAAMIESCRAHERTSEWLMGERERSRCSICLLINIQRSQNTKATLALLMYSTPSALSLVNPRRARPVP